MLCRRDRRPALSAIADHLILVLMPEAKSLTEAYGIIKTTIGEFGCQPLMR